jgi:hypothetical protein
MLVDSNSIVNSGVNVTSATNGYALTAWGIVSVELKQAP